ncbi:MAG TPA: DUF4242 domain-containing protein [Burkholderiales bacterium]|nr:DUF4242 domain-containing protein [Burkholderiales bacterium]
MRRYVIERQVPNIGSMSAEQMCQAAAQSNQALAKLAPRVQWQHSYVAGDRTFCVYLAEDENVVKEHARLSGFPADRIVEVPKMMDPTTGDRASAGP